MIGLLGLLVEDSVADMELFHEALAATALPLRIEVVENGLDAIRFLRREPPYTDAGRPDVVVMDLNLPLMDGREVLAAMAAEPMLREIPVAILSGGSELPISPAAYPCGRLRHFVKPHEFRQLVEMVEQIVEHARR